MTTYETFRNSITDIKHGEINGKSLVLGWRVTVRDINNDVPFEVLYALHVDGRVKETNPLNINNCDFDIERRGWYDVETVPDHAEYIGNYENTMFDAAR